MGVIERYNEKMQNKKETSAGTNTKMGVVERYELKKKYSGYDTSQVDQNYISSFISDANSFFGSVNGFGMEYDSAQPSISELDDRYNTVRVWIFNNKEGFDKDKYDELNKTFNDFGKGLDTVKEYYSSFSSKEEYDYYKTLNDIEKMTSDDILNYLNGDSDIAYTSPDGKNVTWQSLYDRKKLDEDVANQINAAKADSDYDRLVNEGNALDGEIKWNGPFWYGPVVGENKIASYRGEVGAKMSAASLLGGRGDEEISTASYMTEDEANLYSYYLMKNGTAAADKYFDSLKPILKERQQGKAVYLAADFANKYPELSSLVSIGTNLVSSGEYLADMFNTVTNLDLDEMDSHSAAVTNILRNGAAEKYNWNVGDFDVFDFIYNTGMSMADSMVSGLAFGGTAGGASLALSAAAHGTNDAINRGMPKWQAILSGVSSGVFEYMFERVSLENFEAMQEVAKYSAKDIAKNIAKSMVVNASEETLTEIANIAYDTIVNGDFSNYETTIRTYMQEGMSEKEARRKAALDLGAQVGEAAASGAFMGVGFSSVGNTIGRINRANEAKALYGNSQGELVKDALEIDPGNSYAKSMQARLNNKKSLSGGQLARLAENNGQTIIKKNKQQLLPTIKDKLTERGEKKGVKILSEIIAKEITGEELASYEVKILNSNKNAKAVLNEILPEGSDKIEFNRNLYNLSKPKDNNAQDTKNTEAQTAQEQTAAESTPHNKGATEGENTASNVSEATLDGQAVTIKEVSSVDDGNVTLRLSDGREVMADSLEFESSQDRFLYKTLAKMGIDAEGANQLIKGYVPGEETSMEDYVLGIERAFETGKYSLPSREVMADEYANKLTKEQRALAYVLGQESAKAQTSDKQGAVDKKRSDNTQKKKQGKVHYDKTKTLSERQKVSIEALEKIADALGIEFYLFESKVDEKGNRKGTNGWFDPKDGSVHIDLFAGEKGNETILFTAAHELTHFIREWSPAKFKFFADFLMEQYGKSNELVTDLISEQISKAKKNGREIDFDTAYEEIIADSCEAMLTDSNAINKIAELKAKDKKLWEKIKDYFTALLSKIKKVYNKLLPDSTEGRFVKGILTEVERLQELWTDALVDAAESFIDSETIKETSGEKKYSFKKYTDKQKENWKASKRIILYDNDTQFKEFIYNARNDKEYNKKMYFGSIPSELATLIYKKTGIDVENFNCSLSAYEIKKIFKDHGKEEKEAPRGQRAITENDIINIPNVILSPEKIKLSPKLYQGKPVIEFSKQFNGMLNVAAVVSDKHLDLFVQTAYVGIKKGNFSLPISEQALINTPEANKDTVSNSSISQPPDSVKKKFSDRDPEAIERMEKINEIQKYSYDVLIRKSDMEIGKIDNVSENEIKMYQNDTTLFAKDMRKFASEANNENNTPTKTYLYCKDLGKDILITKESFKHGAARLEGAYISVCKNISNVLSNSIVVNELSERDNTNGAYVLLGLVENNDSYIVVRSIVNKLTWKLEDYHELYAIKKKSIKKEDVGLKPPHYIQKNGFGTSSIISISDFLSFVNSQKIANSVLSLDVLEKLKANRSIEDKVTPNLLYSDRDPEAIERMEKINEFLKEENEQLKEDVFRLEELVKIQQQVTTFTKTSIDAAANYLMNISHAKGSKKEFAKILNEFYSFIAKGEELTWYSITERAQPVIDWLYEHIGVKAQISEEAREVLDNIKGSRIYLDDMQKAEVNGIYGSYASYRNKLFGTLVLSEKDSISLDSKWQEWAEMYPNYFDVNTNSNDMPSRLLDIIVALRKPDNTALENDYTRELAEQELLQQIYDSYWRVSTMNVRADKIGEKVNALKSKHNKAIEKIKEEHRRKDEDLKKLRKGKLGEIRTEQRIVALRHKISNVVYDLNRNLLKGGKKSNIPEKFHSLVAKTLDIVDVDIHPLKPDERIRRIKERIPFAKDKEAERKLWKRIKNIEEDQALLKGWKEAYTNLKKNTDPDVALIYDETVDKSIEQVQTMVGETPLHAMTLEQLQLVYDMYSMVRSRIAQFNKDVRNSKASKIEKDAKMIEAELKEFDDGKNIHRPSAGLFDKYVLNNLKPETAFELIGSKTLKRYYRDIRAGEERWAKDVYEAKQFCQEKMKEHGFKKWDFKKTYRYNTVSGEELILNLEHLLSIYAYSRRDAARKHLLEGGITLNDRTPLYVDGKKRVTKRKATYKIGEDIMIAISNDLTKAQRDFVIEMQRYLSLDMGKKGNEVSRKLYGIKLFNEENYFPMKVDGVFMPRSGIESNTVRWLVDKGFTNPTVKGANNAIILTPFMDTWAGHVNEMSMYHALAIPLDEFKRVYNYNQKATEEEAPNSIRQKLINAHGAAAADYIDQLLKDINGGVRADPREGVIKKLVSLHKKISVSGSVSVVIQQPTSAVRAMALIDPKYFVINKNAKLGQQKHKESWEEIKKYAPVAMIKEMGRFDTGMGQTTIDWLKNKKTLIDMVDDVTSLLPAKADEMAWVNIWKAVKRETVLKHTNIAYGSERFFEIAGERFTEIITKTQVYDSVFTRSGNMRSKSAAMNILTAFMGEPTTIANMIYDAKLQSKRGGKAGKAQAIKTIAAVFGSVVLNSAMVALWYAARDDDEDETYIEKYLSSFTSEMIDGINPLTYIPIVRDIYSALLGYDIERSDMTMIDDAIDAIYTVIKIMNKDTEDMDEIELDDYTYSVVDAWLTAAANVLSFTGFSFKNLYKEGKAGFNLYNTFKKDLEGRETTWLSLGDALMASVKKSLPVLASQPEKSKREKLYEAIIKEDEAYEERLKGSYKNLKSAQSAIRAALKEHFLDGDIDNEKVLELIIEHSGLSEEKAEKKIMHWIFEEQYKDYDLGEAAVFKYYDKLEESEIGMDIYYEYYTKKKDCVGSDEDGDGEIDSGSRKKKILDVINSLPITKQQKDALYYAEGWAESTIDDAPWN